MVIQIARRLDPKPMGEPTPPYFSINSILARAMTVKSLHSSLALVLLVYYYIATKKVHCYLNCSVSFVALRQTNIL